MIPYQEIVIHWSGLQSLEELLKNKKINKHNVLYQIYGDSHIYGRETLLYIGKCKNINNRLKQHLNSVFGYVNNLKVTIGDCLNYNDKLEVPESILIANHKPSFNKEYIHLINKSALEHKIIIINNGNNLMLKTCCTNYWWLKTNSD